MSAAAEGQDRSRLREWREAQDRRSRPRALATPDSQPLVFKRALTEGAQRRAIERGRHSLKQSHWRSKEASE